jgi:hypothetical protein
MSANFSPLNWRLSEDSEASATMAKLEDSFLNSAHILHKGKTPEVAARSIVRDVFGESYRNEDEAVEAWTRIIALRWKKTAPKPTKRTASTRTMSSLTKRRLIRKEARAVSKAKKASTGTVYPTGVAVHVHND